MRGYIQRSLVFTAVLLCVLAVPIAVSAQTQISDATANMGTGRDSFNPNVDLDGSRVVFESDADMLSEGRPDGDTEIWLWDDVAGLSRLTDMAANMGTGRDSYLASINNAGTRVAFRSDADLLSEGRADNDYEIWLWDEVGGLQRITDAAANMGTGRDSYDSWISANGNRVAFRTDADLLAEGRADNDYEIWLWDDVAGLTRLTDGLTNGVTGRDSYEPAISADGSRICFQSDADLLSEGRASADEEIWLWDEVAGLQRLTDTLTNGGTGRDFYDCAISADGTRVVFRGDGDLLAEGRADNDNEIWLWDDVAGFTRLTDALTNSATGRDSYEPAISADGSRICFQSDADLLAEGRADNDNEIWLWDEMTGLQRLTDTLANGGTGRDFYDCAISADGTRVAFRGDGDLLSEGRVASDEEIWLWDETAGLSRLTDVLANGATGRDAYDPEISDDGNLISFESDGDFLATGNTDGVTEIWVYDDVTASLTQVTIASDPATRDSYDTGISGDGEFIAFESDSDFLGTGNLDANTEVWLFANPIPVELKSFIIE